MVFQNKQPTQASASNWDSLSSSQHTIIIVLMLIGIVLSSIGIVLLTQSPFFILSLVSIIIGVVILTTTSILWLIWIRMIVKRGVIL